ncbi:carbohydrate-binding protein [Streptomyces sp. M41]|uniref:carbohydrate-binding protein n=1 Tax=Streptomyces sp. M41 TaxID=3059412 RepID=UPI00374CA1B7
MIDGKQVGRCPEPGRFASVAHSLPWIEQTTRLDFDNDGKVAGTAPGTETAWAAGTAYAAGRTVSHQGYKWEARRWTNTEPVTAPPGADPGAAPWKELGHLLTGGLSARPVGAVASPAAAPAPPTRPVHPRRRSRLRPRRPRPGPSDVHERLVRHLRDLQRVDDALRQHRKVRAAPGSRSPPGRQNRSRDTGRT